MQDGKLQALLTGSGNGHPGFEQVLVPHDNETVPAFVKRAALFGASQLAPYSTTLYLLQVHSRDKDFSDVMALVEQIRSKMPPAPVHHQRSLYENVRGIIMLFKEDPKAAKVEFAKAVMSDPDNPVPAVNLAFAEIETDDYAAAAERMERLLRDAPPGNNVLHATAYMTWAAANMGMKDAARADVLLAKAIELYPTSSTAYDLWAEAKDLQGNHAEATALRQKALDSTADLFENYAEVAALYFRLGWQDNMPVTRNRFAYTEVLTFH
jgi:Tfp pilus assembly protein PilF